MTVIMKFLYTAHITVVSWRFTIHFKHECESQTTTPGTTSPTLANSVLPWKSKPQGRSIVWQFLRLSFPRSRQEDLS